MMNKPGFFRRWMRSAGLSGILLDVYAGYRLSGISEAVVSNDRGILGVAETVRDVSMSIPLTSIEAVGHIVKQVAMTAYSVPQTVYHLGKAVVGDSDGLANAASAFQGYADSWSHWYSFLHNVEAQSASLQAFGNSAPIVAASLNVLVGSGVWLYNNARRQERREDWLYPVTGGVEENVPRPLRPLESLVEAPKKTNGEP